MAFNVAEFRSQMTGDGARPNLFSVSLAFPQFVDRKSTRLNSSHMSESRMPSSA